MTIQGNLIGVGSDGVTPLPNAQGIQLTARNVLIGGTNAGEGNVIAFNTQNGVYLSQNVGSPDPDSVDFPSYSIRVLSNSIHSNGKMGIDLELAPSNGPSSGPLPNDAGDVDARRQNYPVITKTAVSGGNVTVEGTLNSTANRSFRLEFFANDAVDATGFGEGRTYLGFKDVTTDGSGNVSFTAGPFAGVTAAQFITSTATDSISNDTSEFSQVTADVGVSVTDAPDPATTGGQVTYAFTVTNGPASGNPSGAVTLTVPVPSGATFVSATGGATPSAGSVVFSLGTLAVGASVQRDVVLTFASTGSKSVTGTVTSGVTDPNAANDSATASTTVTDAPTAATISGTVRDGSNAPLAGVTVTLSGSASATATSAVNGTYSFTNLALRKGTRRSLSKLWGQRDLQLHEPRARR